MKFRESEKPSESGKNILFSYRGLYYLNTDRPPVARFETFSMTLLRRSSVVLIITKKKKKPLFIHTYAVPIISRNFFLPHNHTPEYRRNYWMYFT